MFCSHMGIIFLFVCAFFLINKKETKPIEKPTPPSNEKPGKTEDEKTEEVVKNEIDTFIETIFKEDVTKEEIEKLVNSPVDVTYIFYGKDSYMRTGFTFGLKGLDEYDKKLDELADKLDAKVKENFVFELTEYIVSAEGDVIQRNKFKSYYYVQFVTDYMALRNELLQYTDIDLSELANRDMTQAEKEKMYKINVKAFELISYHFDDYINKNAIAGVATIKLNDVDKIVNPYSGAIEDGFFGGGMLFMQTSTDFTGKGTVTPDKFTASYVEGVDDGNSYWTVTLDIEGKEYTTTISEGTIASSLLLKGPEGDYIQVTNPGFEGMNDYFRSQQNPPRDPATGDTVQAYNGNETVEVTPSVASREMGLSSKPFTLAGGTDGGVVTLDEINSIAIAGDGTITVSHGELGNVVAGRIS